MIEDVLKTKLDRGLPMSNAEFSRLARQLYTMITVLEKELNEIKVSLPRPGVDSPTEGNDISDKPIRSKSIK
jgi:hypothetical protein